MLPDSKIYSINTRPCAFSLQIRHAPQSNQDPISTWSEEKIKLRDPGATISQTESLSQDPGYTGSNEKTKIQEPQDPAAKQRNQDPGSPGS